MRPLQLQSCLLRYIFKTVPFEDCAKFCGSQAWSEALFLDDHTLLQALQCVNSGSSCISYCSALSLAIAELVQYCTS